MTQTCEIHNVELQNDNVEVRRGYPPAPPQGYDEAATELFPHANAWVLAGCVILDDLDEEDDYEQVQFCSQCRIAQKSWLDGREVEDFWLMT